MPRLPARLPRAASSQLAQTYLFPQRVLLQTRQLIPRRQSHLPGGELALLPDYRSAPLVLQALCVSQVDLVVTHLLLHQGELVSQQVVLLPQPALRSAVLLCLPLDFPVVVNQPSEVLECALAAPALRLPQHPFQLRVQITLAALGAGRNVGPGSQPGRLRPLCLQSAVCL